MALQKTYQLEDGFVADYWRIDEILLRKSGSATVTLRLYKDKKSAQDGKSPTPVFLTRAIESNTLITDTENILQKAYKEAKKPTPDEPNFFEDALDV